MSNVLACRVVSGAHSHSSAYQSRQSQPDQQFAPFSNGVGSQAGNQSGSMQSVPDSSAQQVPRLRHMSPHATVLGSPGRVLRKSVTGPFKHAKPPLSRSRSDNAQPQKVSQLASVTAAKGSTRILPLAQSVCCLLSQACNGDQDISCPCCACLTAMLSNFALACR